MTYYMEYPSPLGAMVLAATEHGIRGIYFMDQKHFKGPHEWELSTTQTHLQQAAQQLEEYFAGSRSTFSLELDLHGTEFQQAVWRQLLEIPFGQTSTYARHALSVGRPKAQRAVGAAIGRNPVSIVVPCHRVLGSTGAATGYAGGLDRKRRLLELEGRSPGRSVAAA
ncbi:methylated-DNA--[protein]-cysteine S-methyltransferase [soil metagenome]